MFKVGDVVRHKASGERYVVVEVGDGCYCCDSGYDCTRWLRGVCLEAAPPLADSCVSRSALNFSGETGKYDKKEHYDGY